MGHRRPVIVFLTDSHRPREARRRRAKLHLLDLAFILLVTALGSSAMRAVAARLLPATGRAPLADYAASAVPLGIAATGVLAGYRLLRSGGRSRAALREPGAIAEAILFLTLLSGLVIHTGKSLLYEQHIQSCQPSAPWLGCPHRGWVAPDPHYLEGAFFQDVAKSCGLVVILAWVVLASTGRWRPPRDWIDVAGRWLGACWIAASLASLTGIML
jgi:hypothetical protein